MRYATATIPSASLAGWTPGTGVSTVDPGGRDISGTLASGFSTSSTERSALSLSAAPAPVLGTTVTWTTSNLPSTALGGQMLLSVGQQAPPIDLAFLGAPTCFLHVQLLTYVGIPLFGTGTVALPLTLPTETTLIGASLFSQSVAIDLASNPAGILTSNGVRSTLNAF